MVSGHIRSNLIGYLALFFALTGSAAALQGRNTVDSGDVKQNTIRTGDVKDQNLTGEDLANNSLTGEDIDESKLSGVSSSPTGSAGGDLTGNFPSPSLASNAVQAGEIENGQVTGADVNEGTLGQVPSAAQATNATNATNASNADSADSADNAALLDGVDSGAFVQDADSLPGASDLAGTYANPQVDQDAVGSGEVEPNSLTDADIANTSTLDTDEINEAGLNGLVDATGVSSCCTLAQELLDMGTPFSAGDPDTFMNVGLFQLRTTSDDEDINFCLVGAGVVSTVLVYAYQSGTRTTLALGPGSPGDPSMCQLFDINGAATTGIGDFEFRAPFGGIWIVGFKQSDTFVYALR
jgi:hypothetical protein